MKAKSRLQQTLKARSRKGKYVSIFSIMERLFAPWLFLITISCTTTLYFKPNTPWTRHWHVQPANAMVNPMVTEIVATASTGVVTTSSLAGQTVATPSAQKDDFKPQGRVEESIYEAFGDDAQKAITVLKGDGKGFIHNGKTYCRTGENPGLRADAINTNKNGSIDVGLWQINVRPTETEEIERLKDVKYNTERALKKYRSGGNTFYHWTCGKIVGDYTYLDKVSGN